MDYRMHRRGEQWLVYDVSIEGIIQASSFDGLLHQVRARLADNTAADAKPDRAPGR